MKSRIALVVVSLVLSLLIGLTLRRGAGGDTAGTPTRPLIGLSMDTLEVERWQHDRDLFEARAKQLGADVLVVSANGSDTRQVRDCEALIANKISALVINVAIVAYLLYAKRLFGLRGGVKAEEAARERDIGWDALERSAPERGGVAPAHAGHGS